MNNCLYILSGAVIVGSGPGEQSIAEEEGQDGLAISEDEPGEQGIEEAAGNYHDILETWRGS